jgi:hypothetical protein
MSGINSSSSNKPPGQTGGGNNNGQGSNKSAWSRPLGGGGQQRPPPGMPSGGGGGGGVTGAAVGGKATGGWANRGAGAGAGVGVGAGAVVPPSSSSSSSSSNGHRARNVVAVGTTPVAPDDRTNATSSSSLSAASMSIFVRERFLHLILSMVGQTVVLTTNDGRAIEGILHTFTPFSSLDEEMRNVYVIKGCRSVGSGSEGGKDGEYSVTFEEGSTVVVPSHKVSNVNVKSMRLDATPEAERSLGTGGSGGDDGFRTDSQISGGRGIERGLVEAGLIWTSAGDGGGGMEGNAKAGPTSADAGRNGADALNWRAAAARGGGVRPSTAIAGGGLGGGLEGSIGDWDQFSANEKKFNVRATFDENLYTTKLDVSSIDASRRAEAERIAREIESTPSTNMHIAEERNQAIATDYDEEDRYSGVLTKDLKARAIVSSVPAVVKDEKKAAVVVGGKVMNYAAAAQAAAKKGMAEVTLKPAAVAVTAPVVGSIPNVSEDIENKASSPPPVTSQPTEVSPEEDKSMPQGDHEKDAHVDEGDTKKDKSDKDEKKATTASSKLKLNPNAKTFTFNPTAKTFTPSFTAPPPPPPLVLMQQAMDATQAMPPHLPVDYPGGPHMMGNMGPGVPQFVHMHGKKFLVFTPSSPHVLRLRLDRFL